MKEYIERESVMQAFSDFVWNSNHSDLVPEPKWNHAVDIVRDIPAADVVEQKHGSWQERIVDDDEFDKYGFFRRRFYCSACGDWNTHGASKYCPHCGAKMDGGVNDGKAD